MILHEIFISSTLDIDGLAALVRDCLKLSDRNKSAYQSDQKRDSANKGGTYYLFESEPYTVELLRNTDDVSIAGRAEWPYYLLIYPTDRDPSAVRFERDVADVVKRLIDAGLNVERDTLT